MSAQSFTFDGYTVRPLSERDRPYLDEQIKTDPFHRGRMDADYFLKVKPGEDSWALEDGQGRVVFYFKTAAAVRLSIQFPSIGGAEDKTRNRTAMLKGLAWIEGIFRANRFREILFDTEGVELANFAKRRLGFIEPHGLLIRPIDPPTHKSAPEARQEAWEASPQSCERVG
jgi:hypothetical protein